MAGYTCGGCSRWWADTAERVARREAATWSWARPSSSDDLFPHARENLKGRVITVATMHRNPHWS